MACRKEFGVLLYELSQRLNGKEITAIIHIEDLPRNLEGKNSLEILIQLQMLGKITESDPSTLQSVFKNINRIDLVNKVKDFSKSQKKKKTPKSGGLSDRVDKMVYDLDANLKVSLIQTQVLRDQLINVATVANTSGEVKIARMIQESIRALHNEVERTIISARNEEDRKDSSSSPESSGDDDTPKSTLIRQQHQLELAGKIAEKLQELQPDPPFPTQEENKQDSEDEGLYEVISNTPLIPSSSPSGEHYYATADMVPPTGPITSTIKDIVPNDTQRQPRDMEYYSPMDLSLRSPPKNKSKPKPPPKPSIKKSQCQHKDEGTLDSSIDDCSYTGGTGSSADSGFSESWRYLKRPIALPRHSPAGIGQAGAPKSRPVPSPRPPPKANSYTTLNTDQVKLSYYKSSARENNQKFQDLVSGKLTEREKEEEPIYQNL